MKQRLKQIFTLDLRSLALFRIALALLLLVDAIVRILHVDDWYTDFGTLPVSAIGRTAQQWSLHAYGTSATYETCLFAVSALAATALLFGIYARVALVVVWLLTLSIQLRNTEIHGASATAIRVALFWALTLPIAARWSIDRIRRRPPGPISMAARAGPSPVACPGLAPGSEPNTLFSIGSFAILLQVFAIYPLTLYAKLKPPCCWRNLMSAHYVVYDDRIATSFAVFLRRFAWAHRPMTATILFMEGVPPCVALLGGPRLRTAAALAMIALHTVFIPSVVNLGGTFPAIMATLWTVYLPSWFWDEGLPRVRAALERTAPIAGAALAAARRRIEALTARIPKLARRPSPELTAIVATVSSIFVALAVVLWLTVTGLSQFAKQVTLPSIASTVAKRLGLKQSWGVYVGKPKSHQYVFAATLSDGSRVDIRRDGAGIDWKRKAPQATSGHWIKYETNAGKRAVARRYADYLVRRWDRDHPENPVEELELIVKHRLLDQPFRYQLLWQADYDPIEEPRGPVVARNGEREGKRVRLDLDPRTLEGRRAKLKNEPANGSEGGDRLVPLTTVGGKTIVVAADTLPEARKQRRIVVQCRLEDARKIDAPRVRYNRDTPWLDTKGKWQTGTLTDCKRSSSPPRSR